ncbi:olfactory receptor 6F1-like [Pleurodeles waltl]|uniref:olfactory receptor 6F1-like n=1 Tax=Pleurodeles waltl TaxID=8319 RepID=UPI0037099F2F
MEDVNTTSVTQFILLGFKVNKEFQIFLFVVLCNIYIVTIFTNIVIIAVIRSSTSLHKPMYLFIGIFSFLEIWYPTATVPKFLTDLLTGSKSISFTGCITQFYFHFSLGATENFLLVTMAFDRYVAICSPLRYTVIMTHRLCIQLALGCWGVGFVTLVVTLIQISRLNFCGPKVINHYYCDFAPLLTLSCSETKSIELIFFILATVVLLGCLLVVIVSYVCIIFTIIRMSSDRGRRKTFSTCASHLTVLAIFYGTAIFMFVKPTGRNSLQINKAVSVFPSIVTPLLNPIIYTLRNKEIKNTLRKGVESVRVLQKMYLF